MHENATSVNVADIVEIKNRRTGAVLFEAHLSTEYRDMSRAVRLGAAVRMAFWAHANLTDADLAGAKLAGAKLARFRLTRADLTHADLTRADLTDAHLTCADLTHVDLAYACLTGSELMGADLTCADLTGAKLVHADLRGAYLARACFVGADLTGARWNNGLVLKRPPIQIYGLEYPVTIFDEHMRIGCELHTLAEWATFDDEAITRMDVHRARRFWERHKVALLALAAGASLAGEGE
jgi:uncharacterized protein YjbI with pentapeptide repeats